MPTFYDPIALEDIDITDNAASFYLISLPNNAGFKFCATIQNLNNPQIGFDPETKVSQYWPITRDQISHANLFYTKEELSSVDNGCRPAPLHASRQEFLIL